MPELDDHELLAEFARNESESAFATLVERYVSLVYSTALRFTGNPHHAEEITQAVFIILARKAGKLSPRVVLSGWLYQVARFTAANFTKSESRRQHREQEAFMQTILNEPDAMTWKQIAPLLDEAMGKLGETDRNAVVLRFFENKTAAEVAAKLKLTEAAAHKRVNRALEKLRKFFTKRGVSSTTAIIAGTISTNSIQAAPVTLAKSVTAVAIAKGSIAAASTITLVKGTMKMMTWLKIRTAIGFAAAILLMSGATTAVLSQSDSDSNLTPQEIAKQSQDAYAALTSYSDNGTVATEIADKNIKTTFNIRLGRPNLYRLDWIMTAGTNNAKGAAWSDGSNDYFETKTTGKEKKKDMQMALGSAAIFGNSAIAVPEIFFKVPLGDPMGFIVSDKVETKREKDEQLGGIDCYVISSVMDTAKMSDEGTLPASMGKMGTSISMFWIGKRDHLIHQIQSSVDLASVNIFATLSDAGIKKLLEKENKPVSTEAIAAKRTELEALAKKMQSVMKGKTIVTETHENISVNQKFSAADFENAQ